MSKPKPLSSAPAQEPYETIPIDKDDMVDLKYTYDNILQPLHGILSLLNNFIDCRLSDDSDGAPIMSEEDMVDLKGTLDLIQRQLGLIDDSVWRATLPVADEDKDDAEQKGPTSK